MNKPVTGINTRGIKGVIKAIDAEDAGNKAVEIL